MRPFEVDDAGQWAPQPPPTPNVEGPWVAPAYGDRLGILRPCRFGCGTQSRQAFINARPELQLDIEGPHPPGSVSPRWPAFWWTRIGFVTRLAGHDDAHSKDHLFVMHPCEDVAHRGGPPPAPPTREAPPVMTIPDPFGSSSTPAVSFKGAELGTTITMLVTETPELVQSRDFDDNKPEYWPDGNPKMTVVTKVNVNGEIRSLWADKPSKMYSAIQEAQSAAGAVVGPGGTLTVQFYGEEPNKDKKKNATKLYRAHYVPPVVDAFAQQTAAPVAPVAPAAPVQPVAPVAPPVQPTAAVAAPPWAS